MTNKELKEWARLKKIAFNGDMFVEVEAIKERLGYEYQEFVRLNHLMMEQCHAIHNMNMLSKQYES